MPLNATKIKTNEAPVGVVRGDVSMNVAVGGGEHETIHLSVDLYLVAWAILTVRSHRVLVERSLQGGTIIEDFVKDVTWDAVFEKASPNDKAESSNKAGNDATAPSTSSTSVLVEHGHHQQNAPGGSSDDSPIAWSWPLLVKIHRCGSPTTLPLSSTMPARNNNNSSKKEATKAPKTLAKDGFEFDWKTTREERAKKIEKALEKRGFAVDPSKSTPPKKPAPIKKGPHHHAPPSSAAGMPFVAGGSAGLQLVNGHNIIQSAGAGGGGSLGGTVTPGTPGSSWGQGGGGGGAQGGGGGSLTVHAGGNIMMNHNEVLNGRGLAHSHTSTTTYQSPPGWT